MKRNIQEGKDKLTCTMLYVERQYNASTGRYEAMKRNSDVKVCFIAGSNAQVSRKWDKARPVAANRTAMAVKNFAGDNVAHWRQQQLVTHNVAEKTAGSYTTRRLVCARQCRPAQNTLVDMNFLPEIGLTNFDVLLTVYLSIILAIDQLNAQMLVF